LLKKQEHSRLLRLGSGFRLLCSVLNANRTFRGGLTHSTIQADRWKEEEESERESTASVPGWFRKGNKLQGCGPRRPFIS